MSTSIESTGMHVNKNPMNFFYVDFHYHDFLILFDNLHVTFRNSYALGIMKTFYGDF